MNRFHIVSNHEIKNSTNICYYIYIHVYVLIIGGIHKLTYLRNANELTVTIFIPFKKHKF